MKHAFFNKTDQWIGRLGLILLIFALGSCARGPKRPVSPEGVEGIPIKITAAWALGIWILAQVANLFFDSAEAVAWWAHLGGFVAGAVLILFMRRRGVILFDRTRGGA